jgi:hypothetical protein
VLGTFLTGRGAALAQIQQMAKSATKGLSKPQISGKKKSKLSTADELDAWREYFTVERRAQIQDRFAFLTQAYNLDDPEEIRLSFSQIYEKCIVNKPKQTSSKTKRVHKPPRVEPDPEVTLGRLANERQFLKMKRLVERIKPRRPPFLVRTFQVETNPVDVK